MYRILHIFSNSDTAQQESEFTVKNTFIEVVLTRLGWIKKKALPTSSLQFGHSIVRPSRIQEIIKDQVAHLRTYKLNPLCIFIGSQDYSDLCEYADFSLIRQVSYIESVRTFEEIQTMAPQSSQEQGINGKIFEAVLNQHKDLINKKFQRIPGSLIVSGYRFLDLPLIILPWLSGVFVAPDLSEDVEPNTTMI